MGSDSASEGNKDITIKGDINVYIFGKIKNNLMIEKMMMML